MPGLRPAGVEPRAAFLWSMATPTKDGDAAGRPPEQGTAFGRAVAPLKDRHYRNYWFSNALFTGGQQMQMAARQYLVTEITGSRTLLGLTGFLGGAVGIVVSPIAGVIGDRVSQKQLLLWARAGLVALALLIAFLVVFDSIKVWHILAISLAAGVIGAISQPATQTFIYNLVGRERLTSAIALNSVANGLFQTFFLALGGVLIGLFSIAGNFFLAAAVFLFAIALFWTIPENRRANRPRRAVWLEVREGFVLAKQDKLVLGCVLLATTTLLSTFPFALRVVIAKDELHAGGVGFGILNAASAAGSVVGSFLIAMAGGVKQKGMLVLVMSMVKEIATLIYAFSPYLWLSASLDFVMGLYVASFMTMLTSMIQMEVPEHMRSRALSLFFMAISAAAFGSLLAGVTADLIGDRWAIAWSAIVRGIIVILIFTMLPKLRNYGRPPLPPPTPANA